MAEALSIDDFDWSGGASAAPPVESPSTPEEPAPPPEPVAPPRPAPRRGRQRSEIDPELLPPAYRDYEGRKNVYKRRAAPTGSIDDFDWGEGQVSAAPSGYNPASDWAITRGAKAGYQGGASAMGGVADMARIATMSPDEQAAEMVKIGQLPPAPDDVRMQVPGVQDIGGFGDALTWLGESAGQMAGSWAAAALYGGGSGAGVGAAVGGAGGAAVGGVGALPGAAAGAVTGFGYGTLGAFGAMGVGGMFQDLLHDEGVQKGLADGSVTPGEIYTWSTLGGAAIGALDAAPAAKFAGKFTKKAAKDLVKQTIIKGTLKQMAEEGATEAAQGAISEVGQAIVGGDTNALDRSLSVLNQGLAGAVGAAGPGAVGTVVENAHVPPPGQPTPGGLGNVAPPPAGAKTTTPTTPPIAPAPAGGVTVVPAGGVAPEVAAATAPAAAATTPAAAATVPGEEEFDQPEADEYAAPAPVDPDAAAALAAGAPAARKPARPAQVPPVAPAAPQAAPEAPAAVAEAAPPVVPPTPSVEAPAAVAAPPAVETPPPVAPPPPVAEAAPQPPAPREVVTAQPTLEALVGPQPEADVARTRQLEGLANYASAIEPRWDSMANGYVVEQSDLKDAQGKLRQLSGADDAEGFNTFWSALDQHVRAALERWASSLQPAQTAPLARPAAPPATAAAVAAPSEPAAAAAAPRAAVALKPAAVAEAPRVVREAPPVTRKTLRMTLRHYQNVLNAQGPAAAQALLEKATIRHAKSRRRLGVVTGTTEQGGVTVSYRSKKKPLSVEELLGKHAVEAEVQVAGKQPPLKVPPKTGREAVIEQLRKHFRVGKRKAVQLKPLGFSDDEIAALERAGMAETGSMDAAEFGRWEASRRGAAPEPTGRPLSEGNVEPKVVPYIEIKRKPEPGAVAEKARIEEEAKPYVREPTGRLQGAKNIFKKGKRVGRGSQLRQQVEQQLRERISLEPGTAEEADYKPPPQTPAEIIRSMRERNILAAAREDVAARAASQIAKGKTSAPGQLARAHLKTAVDTALELYRKGEQTREQARQAILDEDRRLEDQQLAEAQRMAAVYRAEEAETFVERTGKEKGKSAEGIAKEDINTQRQRAYAEAEKDARLPRNQLRLDMAEIFHKLKQLQRKKDKQSILARNLYQSQIRQLHQQLVAEQRVVDKAVKKEKLMAEAQARRDAKFVAATMERAVKAGLISQEEANAIGANAGGAGQRYKAKIARARKSRPALIKAIKAHPLALETPRADLLGMAKQIRLWATDFVAAAERELRKAGTKLPNKRSRFFNTPEENGVLFIKQALSGKVERGMGMNDAWMTGYLLGERAKPKKRGITDEQWLMDLHNNEDELNGTLFDASKTAAVGYETGPVNRDISAAGPAQLALDNRQRQVWQEQQQQRGPEGPMAEPLRRWAKEHGLEAEVEAGHISEEDIFGSPDEAPTDLPLGEQPKKLTGAEALDKYVTGSRAMEGTPPWQRWIRKYVTRHMRELVGDTPVYVVDPAVIASFSESGQQRGGQFLLRTASGKPNVILLNRNLFGAPKQLANTIFHEMTHAATAHALANNVRGTRDVVNTLIGALKAQVGVNELSDRSQYALGKPEEFLTAGLEDPAFQDMLASLQPNARTLAKVRALGAGRTMPTYWDLFVGMVQRAIGAFTTGNGGRSYLDQVLKIYPHVAMTSAEQQAEAAAQRERGVVDGGNAVLDYPFDIASLKPYAEGALRSTLAKGSSIYRRYIEPTENMVSRVAEEAFGGSFDNPLTDASRALTTHRRLVEDEMRDIDQVGDGISRWMREDITTRGPQVAHAHETAVEASLDGVDPRVSFAENTWVWHDALHPTKRKRRSPTFKHLRDTYKRAAYDRAKAEWDKVPDELKPQMSEWLDLMKEKMNKHDKMLVRNWLKMLMEKDNSPVSLPAGMAMDDAVQQLFEGTLSDDLKTALGDNAETIVAIGRFGSRGQMYAPAHRSGQYFISGRRDIATPAGASFDQAEFDKTGKFKFIFQDAATATDYTNRMGASGDERVTRLTRRWTDPRTGETVPHDFHEFDAAGNEYVAKPLYYVTMQDRFMGMSDSAEELAAQRDELRGSGEYKHVSDPVLLSQHRDMPASMMPLQLKTMIHNIDNMSGPSIEEKNNAKSMLTTSFIQTQQGNRVTKKMLRRQGVAGYQTGADEMLRSLRTNNEMMSRSIVALDRIPLMKKAQSAMADVVDAWRQRDPAALAKLPQHIQASITRNVGKDGGRAVGRFSEDVAEINKRIENSMTPTGGKLMGEDLKNATMTMVTLNYLAGPVYLLLQTLGVAMQTVPAMAGEFSRTEGAAGAYGSTWRYLSKAAADVQWLSNYGKGLSEALAEGKDIAARLRPRSGYLAGSRGTRRSADMVEDLKGRLDANAVKYVEAKKRLLDEAKLNNFIGQAGLDQPNLRVDLLGKGLKNKVFRGVEASARVFRALAEGIEINNRAIPMLAYLEFYMDKGVPEAQARAKAMNRMVREQTGYARENWPTWMGSRLAEPPMMFKKFGIVQAINFYGSLASTIGPKSSKEDRKAALIHVATMTAIGAAIGGFSGNPAWEPLRLLMYLFGLSDNWNNTKSLGEKWMADLSNPTIAESTMYGLPRLAGVDLSSRVSMDNLLFFQQPDEMSKDAWYTVLGKLAIGAPGAMGFDTVSALSDFGGDKSWPKWLAQLPMPKLAKDVLKSYDTAAHGPTTTTGISTGKAPGLIESVVQGSGLRTRSQARPFEQGSAAQYSLEHEAIQGRNALVTRVLNQGLTRDNMRRIKQWDQAHPDKKQRITVKSISEARKRRGNIEREIATKNVE